MTGTWLVNEEKHRYNERSPRGIDRTICMYSVACPDGGYQEYRLTLMHFAVDREVELVVKKTGGDLCRLDSDALQFRSSLLLVRAAFAAKWIPV